jgi:type 1 glutamine amidotransferase
MSTRLALGAAAAAVVIVATLAAQQPAPTPLRIFIRSGEKTHGEALNGLHDYPRFLGTRSTLLKERGAVVDGALHFPSAQELASTDVLIIFKGDGGTCSVAERGLLESYLKRGGGLVTFHDGMCSDDAPWFATIAGAAKQHGERNSSAGMVKYTLTNSTHPITQGLGNFEIDDEAFFALRTTPEMQVLATAPLPNDAAQTVPQIWTAERTLAGGKPHRSFVWMQGHRIESFAIPQVQTMLLRAIAWAGRRPIDLLTNAPAPPERGGGRGGRAGRGAGGGATP